MEAMGELMAAKYSGAGPIQILPTRLGNSGNFHFWVKWEFLFDYFRRKTVFEETILLSRLQAKAPRPK